VLPKSNEVKRQLHAFMIRNLKYTTQLQILLEPSQLNRFFINMYSSKQTYNSIPKGNSWLMAMVALKVFLLSLHTSSLPR
jgi:hypothetical protein